MKNFSKTFVFISTVAFFVIPVMASAFSLSSSTFSGVIDELNQIIRIILPILFSLAFIAFFWGLTKFILNSGSAAEVQKGKSYMIWGVVALFVLISVRTIISLIAADLGLGDAKIIPFIPTPNSNDYGNSTNDTGLPQGVPTQ